MTERKVAECLTFDDVLIKPAWSEILPKDANIATRLTRSISINIPLLSAAMDTVTESATAITMAREGGIGIIHKNLSIEEQALEVRKVKKSESGIIIDPVTTDPDRSIEEVLALMRRNNISGVPVVRGRRLVGIITSRDLRLVRDPAAQKVADVMTARDLVTVTGEVSLEEARQKLHQHRIEKLLVVDENYDLIGLYTYKDIEKTERYPTSSKDAKGRLIVGAAVGTAVDTLERAQALAEAGVDVIVIDTAHGNSKNVVETVRRIRAAISGVDLVAGNVASADGVERLADAGADAVKVGIGPGSICTTRIVAGVGVPQVTAISETSGAGDRLGVPIIADGGIKYSGDVVKALAAGASSVMIGSLFAGTDESPGELILYQGRSYKQYRGMGSIGAMMHGSRDRYSMDHISDERKLVPEGIEGRVPYRGSLSQVLYQLTGGVRQGMGYAGCRTIAELRARAEFLRITSAGLRESHVHDVIITKEAPNYRIEN